MTREWAGEKRVRGLHKVAGLHGLHCPEGNGVTLGAGGGKVRIVVPSCDGRDAVWRHSGTMRSGQAVGKWNVGLRPLAVIRLVSQR